MDFNFVRDTEQAVRQKPSEIKSDDNSLLWRSVYSAMFLGELWGLILIVIRFQNSFYFSLAFCFGAVLTFAVLKWLAKYFRDPS